MLNENAVIARLLAWYDAHKRDLPFRGTRDPYRVWVSEIMLQQTRAQTVIPYYQRFLQRFPDVQALAQAQEEEVLKLWEGLGYYSRARMLHKTAGIVAQSGFPTTEQGLRELPGIGPYTAAAIASIAFGQPAPAIDGNLTRVLARLYHIEENVRIPSVARQLRRYGENLMPPDRPGDMNQALMDLGATLCVPGTPECDQCPLSQLCVAFNEGEPETLPVLPDARPPRPIPMAVALVTHRDQVLLIQRREKLLHNLYVFALCEGQDDEASAARHLKHLGLSVQAGQPLGSARHVFTHRVWQMELYHFEADAPISVPHGLWATAQQLQALPIPTAMKVARQQALHILSDK